MKSFASGAKGLTHSRTKFKQEKNNEETNINSKKKELNHNKIRKSDFLIFSC